MDTHKRTILVADADDAFIQQVHDALGAHPSVKRVEGVPEADVMRYLLGQDGFADAPRPRPSLIIIGPSSQGADALVRAIKSAPTLRAIPLLLFSDAAPEAWQSALYAAGVNAVLQPARSLSDTLATTARFWLENAQLPDISA